MEEVEAGTGGGLLAALEQDRLQHLVDAALGPAKVAQRTGRRLQQQPQQLDDVLCNKKKTIV